MAEDMADHDSMADQSDDEDIVRPRNINKHRRIAGKFLLLFL